MPFTIPNEADAAFPHQAQPDAGDFRILALAQEGTGVVYGCAVTAQGAPDMTVAVAAGAVTTSSGTSVDVTAGNVTIGAAHATNPRFDLVYVSATGVKGVLAGTAAASPAFPAIGATQVVLAAVYVPANDTAINANQIVDKRAFAALTPEKVHTNVLATDYKVTEPISNTVLVGTFIPDTSEVEVEVDVAGSNWGGAWVPLRFLCGIADTPGGSLQNVGQYNPPKPGVTNEQVGTFGLDAQQKVYKKFKLTGLTPGTEYTYRLQASIVGALYQHHIDKAYQPFNVIIVDPPDPSQDSIHKAYIRLYGTGGVMVMNPIPLTKWATLNARPLTPDDCATYKISGIGVADGGQCATPGEKTVEASIQGAPSGGTWTLYYDGQTTATLAITATAAQVQTALENLSNIAVGEVAVTGADGGPYTIRFTGPLAGKAVPDLFADNTFTGGTDGPWVKLTVTRLPGESPYVIFTEYWAAGGSKIHIISTETDTVIASPVLAGAWATESKSDTLIYVGTDANIYPVTLPAGTVGSAIALGVTGVVVGIAIDRVNNFAYTVSSNAANGLKRVNLSGTPAVTHTATPASTPTAVALSRDGTRLFVGMQNGNVEVRNASTLALITNLSQVDQNANVVSLVVGPGDRTLYVTTQNGWWHYWYIGANGDGPQYAWYDGLQVAQDGTAPVSGGVTSIENIWAVSREGRMYIWPGSEFSIRPSWGAYLTEFARVQVKGVR